MQNSPFLIGKKMDIAEMGLLDFIKSVGHRLLGKKRQPGTSLVQTDPLHAVKSQFHERNALAVRKNNVPAAGSNGTALTVSGKDHRPAMNHEYIEKHLAQGRSSVLRTKWTE
jgi:hypothetical protein